MNSTRSFLGLTWSQWIPIGLIVLAGTLFTRPAIQGQLLNYDDERYIANNALIESLDGEHLQRMFTEYFDGHYHPITLLSLAVDQTMADDAVKAHHQTNWWLHLFNAIWVYLLLLKLFPNHSILPIGTALLFLVHPMNVESYAWMTERKNVLYGFFFLLALLSYTQYAKNPSWKTLTLVYLLSVLSLLSKAQAVVLLPTFFLIDYFVGRGLTNKSLWLEKLPAILLFGVFAFYTREAQAASWGDLASPYGYGEKLFLASAALGSYFLKGLFPWNLAAYYPYPESLEQSLNWTHYVGLMWPIALMLTLFWLWKKGMKNWFFALGFFTINIVLMLKFFEVPFGNYSMADRYNYIPSIGLMLLWGFFFDWMAVKLPSIGQNGKTMLTAALVLIFGWMSQSRIAVWNNSVNLWQDVLDDFPEYGHAQNMLALSYLQSGQMLEAQKAFEQLVSDHPEFEGGYENLATLHFQAGRKAQAIQAAEEALRQHPDVPQTVELAYRIFQDAARYKRSQDLAEQLVLLEPSSSIYSVYLAKALLGQGQDSLAVIHLNKNPGRESQELLLQIQESAALKDPRKRKARKLLEEATALGKRGQLDAAEKRFNESIALDSVQFNAFINRGSNYARMQQYNQALNDYLKASQLAPHQPMAYLMLAAVYKDLNQQEKSCAALAKAQELQAQIPQEMLNYCP